MANVRWTGGAAAVAQVQTFAVAGTWEVGDLIRVIVGAKKWDYAVTFTTIATFVPLFVTAFNALDEADYPEFAGITVSGTTSFTFTADDEGVPFVISLTPLESNGGAADAQTIEGAGTVTNGTAATVATGPAYWSEARNWSGGAVPVNGDAVFIEVSEDDITYGLAQSAVTLASLTIAASFSGTIGLPMLNESGTTPYPEYRATYLAVGATALTIGQGEGRGSGRLRIDNGSVQTTVNVSLTGQSLDNDVPALIWIGTHASNVVNITGGQMAAAIYGGEVATIATLSVGYAARGGAAFIGGAGLTLTTANQTAGDLTLNGAATTIAKTGGALTQTAGAVATLTNDAGLVAWRSTGTITTLNNSGQFDAGQDMRACTITNTNLYRGCSLADPFGRITFTNPIRLVRCALPDVGLAVGFNRTYAISS